MLRPITNAWRDCRPLDGLWKFAVDRDGTGRAQRWWNSPLPGDAEAPVPASYNDLFADPTVAEHVGDVWYQRWVRIPRFAPGERMVLRFDSATHRGTVWLGDTEIADHQGGYLPFEADVTELVSPGDLVRLTVAVNNELTWTTLPPGYVDTDAAGRRRQHYFHDFFNYAGLHRSVWLYTVPAARVSGVRVRTDLDGARGIVHYECDLAGTDDARVELLDAEGVSVASAEGAAGQLSIVDVHPWGPGDGYLYTLRVHPLVDGQVVDEYDLAVGVRTVEVRGSEFLINGKPFYFTGFGKHEDADIRGKAHDNALLVRDFELMDWIGANSFRTSHYPYAEEVLDYADRHGIVVIDETAAVGLNTALWGPGWNGPAAFEDGRIDSATREAHAESIRELLDRDANHPSVVMWSIANEPDTREAAARDYFAPLLELTRELDPTRPVTIINVLLAGVDECVVGDLVDVLCVNRYYGWYVNTGDLASAEVELEAELRAWIDRYGKPLIITEYGADTMAGMHSFGATPWTEEYQRDLLRMHRGVFDRVEGVVGDHVWNFADFQTSHGVMRVDGNKKGVFARDRKPKSAAFELRELWTPLREAHRRSR